MHLPNTGTIFEQKYEILETLGAGGFATVYKARDVELGRQVAIKILAPRDGEYPKTVVARFMVEARVIAQLRDAHTIRLFEFGESRGGLLYMVFQYVAGEDLADVLKRERAMTPETAVHVGKQVLSALAEAHEVGILHRDLKPGNVLIHEYMGDPYTAKLLDFGIAKVDDAVGGVSLTKTGALLGTPRYMAPEQVFAERLSPATDIYSLGLVLYEMLVGRPALEGSQKDILREHAAEKRHHLPEHVAWPSLRAVVERMLAHEPHHRFSSAVEVGHALDAALQNRGQPAPAPRLHSSNSQRVVPMAGSSAEVPAYPVSPRGHSSSNISRQRIQSSSQAAYIAARTNRRALLALGALLVVVIVGAFGLMSKDDPQPAPTRRPTLPTDLLKTGGGEQPRDETKVVEAVAQDLGREHVEPAPVDLSPSAGCGKPQTAKGERWIRVGVGDRKARVFLPGGYDPDNPYPVVLAFGPKYESVGGFAKDSGLAAMTGGSPFIGVVVSPTNRFDPWEDDASDYAAVQGTLDVMKEGFCVDPRLVFGVGHHDGALFVRKLACRMAFAGIAMSGFAEKIEQSRCDLHPVVPTLLVAGLQDEFIPVDGGVGCTQNGPYRSIDDHESFWRERFRCAGDGEQLSKTKTSKCEVWSTCDAPLALCRADGGHHLAESDWALLYPTCNTRTLEFGLMDEAWNFFEKHGQPISPTDPRLPR